LAKDWSWRSRTLEYHPLAICSTGYDSACVAALAGRLGCREAVTLGASGGGDENSGKATGERPGLCVREFDRPELVDGSFEDAACFLATGMGGEDYCYRNVAHLLGGAFC